MIICDLYLKVSIICDDITVICKWYYTFLDLHMEWNFKKLF